MANLTLFIRNAHSGDYRELDLDDVWMNPDVTDEDSFHAALVHEVALYALDQDISFTDVTGLTIDDEDGQELSIKSDSSMEWIREVAQLYVFLLSDKHYCDDEAILAYIDNSGWQWFDFDSELQYAEDEYYTEFNGDYEEFARERMDDSCEGLPEHLESHFDYSSYGEELIEGYSQVTWGSREFLFYE